ncbi:MAG TPA: hypothetical protein VHK01_16340 [Lacipirellulaceae bacterium]|nr:hypothetical protein [Lacipirellulaceae bacterium]
MSIAIKAIDALEILDSRGYPTLRVTVRLHNGHSGTASVPSGASTGRHEALELRDGDSARYNGKGVLKAVSSVRGRIQERLEGSDASNQAAIDRCLIELDGTENKSQLGANAILGVSMAVARAAASAAGLPLYAYLRPGSNRLPVPMMNVINGGRHAENSLDFQEFMIVPHRAPTFAEALRFGAEVFHALRTILHKWGYSVSVGDEGGFAPDLRTSDEACDFIVQAIQAAGLRAGADVAIALDPAASSFCKDERYVLDKSGGEVMSREDLLELYRRRRTSTRSSPSRMASRRTIGTAFAFKPRCLAIACKLSATIFM